MAFPNRTAGHSPKTHRLTETVELRPNSRTSACFQNNSPEGELTKNERYSATDSLLVVEDGGLAARAKANSVFDNEFALSWEPDFHLQAEIR